MKDRTEPGLFLERGWNVLATMRRPDPGVFASESDRLKVLPLDVTDAKSIDKAITDGVATFGPDSQLTSTLRWTTSEDHYLMTMRELFGPGTSR